MRIVQTPVRYPPDVGGVERRVWELSRRLAERGHDVTVVCAESAQDQRRSLVDGVEILRLASPFAIANTDLTPSLPFQLAQLARASDVVHTHLPTPWSADVSVGLGTAVGTPTVLTYHNDIAGTGWAGSLASLYNSTVLPITLRLVDRLLVTQDSYIEFSTHLTGHEGKIETVPNGVDVERFSPCEPCGPALYELGFRPGARNLFFLGVLDDYHGYKGVDVLLEAIAILKQREEGPPNLVVGGDGPVRVAYEDTVNDLGIKDNVTFVGRLTEDELVAAYNLADAFVLASTSRAQEGFGLVLLEALACETPVITTDVVGIAADIESGRFGTLVPPKDPDALADGIDRVLGGSCDGSAGRDLCIQQYSWEASVDELLRIYVSLQDE